MIANIALFFFVFAIFMGFTGFIFYLSWGYIYWILSIIAVYGWEVGKFFYYILDDILLFAMDTKFYMVLSQNITLLYQLVTSTGLFFHTVYKEPIFYYLPYLKNLVYLESAVVAVLGAYLVYFLWQLLKKLKVISRMLYDGELLTGDQEQDCPICLENLLQPYEEIEHVKCGHSFHSSCLSRWVIENKEKIAVQCPMCRSPISSCQISEVGQLDQIDTDFDSFALQ